MNHLIRQHLLRAQVRMKKMADKNRPEREFSVGTLVYLKLQPYVQSSIMPHVNQKFSFKYFGPSKIMESIGSVAYCLLLPDSSYIHPVVHVSQLKLATGFQGTVCSQLLSNSIQHRIPLQILDRHSVLRNGDQVQQVLVMWSELPPDLSTWEDYEALKQTFPVAPAWGQAVFPEPGNVSTSAIDQLTAQSASPRHSLRPTKKSVRTSIPEWV
jgi:hypothetical protein